MPLKYCSFYSWELRFPHYRQDSNSEFSVWLIKLSKLSNMEVGTLILGKAYGIAKESAVMIRVKAEF